jgi:dihydrofolate synthase/folylpolyglutamate synthase
MSLNYDEAITWLYSLENMGIKLGLDRMRKLLRVLGDPQDGFRSVHVAGTNGKGSVSAMCASIFQEAGYRTGLFTSPHLVDFEERIQVDGERIGPNEVASICEEIREIIDSERFPEGRQMTFFEVTTAMAFIHFVRRNVKISVIEVGMGGRLDATNVITPDCTVITRIGLEHVQYLGDTIAKIAYEKAGILKEGVTVIMAEQTEEGLRVIDAVARDRGSPLLMVGRDVEYRLKGCGLDGVELHLHSINRDVTLPLLGSYQAENAAMACECALEVRNRGLEVKESDIAIGLSKVHWPGRLEVVARDPVMIIDVTHNPDGANAVAKELRGMKKAGLVMVLGVLSDKDLRGICREFGPLANKAVATSPRTKRAFPADTVAKALYEFTDDVTIETDVGGAIERALMLAHPDDIVLVTGSLYTAGEAKEWLRRRSG